MAYVGTPLDTTNAFQSLAGKRFNGDGSTTGFTLDSAPNSTLDIEVFIENVRQDPNSAYTVSGTTLTFTSAPPSGTHNIYVVHQAKAVGTIDPPVGSTLDLNGAAELVLDADADTTIAADTDDQIDIKIGGTDVANLTNSSSDLVITQAVQDKDIIFKGNDGGSAITALTIDMSDAGIVNIKSGIGFPATQVASTGANVLDDYEEGVFTVGITAASGSVTMNSSEDTMQYTKIGRLVFIAGRVDISSVSSPSGSLSITGLPFTVGALDENADMAAFTFYGNALTGTIGNLQGISIPSGTTIQVNEFTGTTAANAGDHMAAGTDFAISGFYST